MFTAEEIQKLKEKLSSPQGKEAIDTIITSIESMVHSMNTMKTNVQLLEATTKQYEKMAVANEKACLDLTQTIKHIHIALNQYRSELPAELVQLTNELGTFVMSGAAIKAGVISNANA